MARWGAGNEPESFVSEYGLDCLDSGLDCPIRAIMTVLIMALTVLYVPCSLGSGEGGRVWGGGWGVGGVGCRV